MLKKLSPLLLAVLGTGAGIGAGVMLKPAPAPEMADIAAQPCGPDANGGPAEEKEGGNLASGTAEHDDLEGREYVKMNNQFVVPVVEGERIAALVVMSLSVEVAEGQKEAVYAREPRLRDGFLQVLFDHANQGGFRGAFTNSNTMEVLRRALNEVAHRTMGETITDVLITEIARQDV